MLRGSAPGLLFTASHGLGLAGGDPKLQKALNGALLCQDWKGGEPGESMFFTAESVPDDAGLLGTIAMHFACFGGGTPMVSDFPDPKTHQRPPLAPAPFIAALPQRLLSHENGGALAVIAHIDRAFPCSFHWDGARSPQYGAFRDTLVQLMWGVPVGAAFEAFNKKYAELAAALLAKQQKPGMAVLPALLAGWATACGDSRNFVVFGDPAVRLRFPESAETPQRVLEGRKLETGKNMDTDEKQNPAGNASALPETSASDRAAAGVGDVGYWSPFGGAGDAIGNAFSKVGETIANVFSQLTDIEVTTHVIPDNGDIDSAPVRAKSRIELNGRTESYIPTTGGKPDETIWKLHLDTVDRAIAYRSAVLGLAKDMAAQLMGKK